MSYNDDILIEERSFKLSDDDELEPLEEEVGDFVFEEETDDDPDDRYH